MRVPLLIVIALAMLFVAGSALGQIVDSDDKTGVSNGCEGTMDPEECMFGDGGSAGGGGNSSSGCQYCYHSSTAAYANCFSGRSGLNFDSLANCVGTRICWYILPGIYHCEPICLGNSCLYI
jgi:hypothetical protein